MTTGWALGFDLSLRAPAAVALPLDWRPGDWKRIKTWLVKFESPKQDDLRAQLDRHMAIADWAVTIIRELGGPGPKPRATIHSFVESYGFSKNNAQASKIMESGGGVKLMLYSKFGQILRPVAANTARKLFLGSCPQKDPKTHVQHALFNKCKAPKGWDENQADAFVVVNWGLSDVGGRCLTLSKT